MKTPKTAIEVMSSLQWRPYESFRDVMINEPIVAKVLHNGGSAEDCVVVLATTLQALREEVATLDSIAPKKVIGQDGKVWVWQCPDELIPASRTINASRKQP